jgi:hypothetical protein
LHGAIGTRTSGDPLRTATEVLLHSRGDANQSSLANRAWLDGGYLIDDATASASDSSGHALTATMAPKQSNSTKRCRGASDCKKSLLISRNDRDPCGIIFDVGFIFWLSDLSISIERNSPPLPDSSKTGPRQVTEGEDCVTNRSRDYANLLRHASEREWRKTELKLSFEHSSPAEKLASTTLPQTPRSFSQPVTAISKHWGLAVLI